MEKPRPVNMRLKHRCCTLPFLIKVSMVLLAVCSTMLFLQSIWGNAVKDDNVSKSGKIISKNINSGAVIQRELLPKPVSHIMVVSSWALHLTFMPARGVEGSEQTKHWPGKPLFTNNRLPLQCFVSSEASDASDACLDLPASCHT